MSEELFIQQRFPVKNVCEEALVFFAYGGFFAKSVIRRFVIMKNIM